MMMNSMWWRRRPIVLGASLLLVAPLVSAIAVALPAQPASAASTVVEAPDFASESYGDPWDYSNAADQNTNSTNARSASVAGGRLQLSMTGGQYFDPVWYIPGSLAKGRDGTAVPVNTARYKRLSFDMNISQTGNGVGAFYWFTCQQMTLACAGGITFGTRPGDHVYDLALDGASTIAGKVPWNGSQVYGLRMIPSVAGSKTTAVSVSFDWMRVYRPGSVDAQYPPGTYDGVTVTALPRPAVDSPSPADGQDVTVSQGRRQWNFTQSSNAAGVQVKDAIVKSYGPDGMTATNAGPHRNDPQLLLPISAFPGNTFHYLSFSLTYDGPFSLSASNGGGKLARLIWGVKGTTTAQQSNDIVTFANANSGPISIDLSRGQPLDEDSKAPRLGWAGQTVTSLRFDPNEDPGPNTWHLKSISLRADPAAKGATTVKFHDGAWVPGTTATVSVGTSAPGTAYSPIATNVPVTQGTNSVPFALGSRPAGAYHVEVTLHHPDGGNALAFSPAVVNMSVDTSRNPSGSLDVVSRAPGGATVTGWAIDPDTQSPLTVRFYEKSNAAYLGSTTTDLPRPDVQRGHPAAPLDSGYSTTLALAAGAHTVCAYGINVGSGSNSLLGCKSITVDGHPVGRLDSATRAGGKVTVGGWALDPDTTAAISVRVYANGTYVGSSLASGARSDIARAYPEYGSAHGYSTAVTAPTGANVCVYAIDSAGGANTTLGCKKL